MTLWLDIDLCSKSHNLDSLVFQKHISFLIKYNNFNWSFPQVKLISIRILFISTYFQFQNNYRFSELNI